VAASLNPWSHAYKLATGKVRTSSIMSTLRKPDGTVTSSILETMNTMLDHLITDDREEENQHHKNTSHETSFVLYILSLFILHSKNSVIEFTLY